MTGRKIGTREAEILELYEQWDPDTESVNTLVDKIGISRQRLYAVLDKHSRVPKSKRGRWQPASMTESMPWCERGVVETFTWPTTALTEVPLGWTFSAVVTEKRNVNGRLVYMAEVEESGAMLQLEPVFEFQRCLPFEH